MLTPNTYFRMVTTQINGGSALYPKSLPPVVAEQNEFQWMHARLRQPVNTSEQEKWMRMDWEMQGTEKRRVSKKRYLKKGGG